MSNLQPNCCLKFDFQKVDQHAGDKWLIHDTKRQWWLDYRCLYASLGLNELTSKVSFFDTEMIFYDLTVMTS